MPKNPSKSPPQTSSRGRRRKLAGTAIGLGAKELTAATPSPEITTLYRAIEQDGGTVLATYREPFGGHWVMLAALPIDQVEPTPFQRNLSEAHVRKLAAVIGKLGYFLDPIIAVPAEPTETTKSKYWTPNGHHRLSAMRTLGAQSIMALVIPHASLAYRILALNTEKAHNLREKALEVVRMYRDLATFSREDEAHYAVEFEEPALITLGFCYNQRPRLSGGAYHPILKRADTFLPTPLPQALSTREHLAQTVLTLDDLVTQHVTALKEHGLTSPYLKTFVVARLTPSQFRKKGASPPSLPNTLERMIAAARQFNPASVRLEELARASGAPPDEEE
ncbi:MAG: chromosome partitioning protein ParB [Nitrospirae bacterium]|nr:MAG: chromosome partitioning protein ParB [Nitrospirota bacterium]